MWTDDALRVHVRALRGIAGNAEAEPTTQAARGLAAHARAPKNKNQNLIDE
jgi:hypothetical protein